MGRGNAAEVQVMEGEPGRLTNAECSELQRCEAVVERGIETFIEVGLALAEICEGIGNGPLYRGTHADFEAYLRERWNMSRPHAYRLIRSAETAQLINNGLSPTGDKGSLMSPRSERQVRPLSALPPIERPGAWARAVEIAGGEQPTGPDVQKAVDEVRGLARPARPSFLDEAPPPRAVDAAIEGYGRGIKPLPGQMSLLGEDEPSAATLPPKPKPSRYELMKKWLNDLQIVVMTVNAADTPEQRGWGGISSVRKEMRKRDLQLIRGSIVSLIESLQEWLELLETSHESASGEA